MDRRKDDIGDRLLHFAATIVRLLDRNEGKGISRRLSDQLLRSSTSVGANYEESRAAESRADFIHKMQVALDRIQSKFDQSRQYQHLVRAGYIEYMVCRRQA
jgi:four helix bundle protein